MDLSRQSDILTPHLICDTTVTMIGLGGIGAAAAITLAKLGVRYFELYDPDVVEDVNIPTQFLKVSDIGKPKVVSIVSLMKEVAEVEGVAYVKYATRDTLYSTHIVISSVDTIKARQEIWCGVLASAADWYLDARMSSQYFQLWTVNITEDTGWYEGALFNLSDDGVPDEPCTAKATFFTAMTGSGHIGHQVKRIVMQNPVPKLIEHDIPTFALRCPLDSYTNGCYNIVGG